MIKTTKILTQRVPYAVPVVDIIEVKTERGFADSEDNEDVGKDGVIDF